MPEIKVKKSRKVNKILHIIGIVLIVLQGIYIVLENEYGVVAAANAISDQKAIAAGVSQTTMLIGNIIGTIFFYWPLILGLCFIFIPRLIDKKKAKQG